MIELDNSIKNSLKNYKFIDLFAGVGGFRIALESFGAQCVFTSEWDKNCQRIYEKNFNDICHGDITKIEEVEIPDHDIICAGFPCQAFSISGKQKGFEDSRGTLFFDIIRIAKYHQPRLLILENVKNFERHDNGNTLKVVLSDLDEIGYEVKYKVLNASMFCIPQSRKRIFIVGINKQFSGSFSEYEIPDGNGKKTTMEDFLLPNSEVEKKCFIDSFELDDFIENNAKIEKDIFGNYNQKPIRLGIVNKGGQGERVYSTKGHSITLSAYGGGIFSKTGGYLVDNKIRKLSPRECARLTGFPDSFMLSENLNHSWKQFGNSVVVDVIQEILFTLIGKKLV